ncbi:MAG: GNAT family N-acetyltransferase [Acidobacteria bacterium]|nr:GNAT family N-acetyltransferase [Acidobacteriota bacterium]
MIHADRKLAARLEQASAALGRDAVRAHRELFTNSEAEALPCGSGVAVFLNEDSPLTQVRGAGMDELDLDAVEQFFANRVAPVSFTLTPFASDALWTQLSRREYEIGQFENVLVRGVTPADITSDEEVMLAADAQEWAAAMAEAFFGDVSAMGLDLTRTLHAIPTCRSLIVRAGAVLAAGAQIDIRDGLGVFQCDGTRPAFRGLGLQAKLIRARLSLAAEAGCDLVTADTFPGSQSQRNYERLGFQVAYTKMTLIKPCF